MRLTEISLFSEAEKLTLACTEISYRIPAAALSRIAAFILFTPASAFDISFHGICILPSMAYAIGKSICLFKLDFTVPWQHLQRVQNAITPFFFGSIFGAISPIIAIAVCETTDKHAVVGMLSSNGLLKFQTPCSPIHSFSVIESVAKRFPNVFSKEHLEALKSAKKFEKSLESLQAQEFIYKITNITLFVMAAIDQYLNYYYISSTKEIILRASGVLIPVLSLVDAAIALLIQGFFLTTGVIRLISGRGPAYTEVTANPLMHVTFLIQNSLKLVGNLIGTVCWIVSPKIGFKVSLLPANLFFKMQMIYLMSQINSKMNNLQDGCNFVIPIAFGNGNSEVLALPSQNMHMTYLIVEKRLDRFNLTWVNRPSVKYILNLYEKSALKQIRSMLDERFPFMDMKKLLQYPVQSSEPAFPNSTSSKIDAQGNNTNCAVSNIFGVFETFDVNLKSTSNRYKVFREAIAADYSFYKNEFHPFIDSISYLFNQQYSNSI